MPEHGVRIINRLLRAGNGGTSVADLRADFLACREKPLQVTASWRGAHLVLLASLLAFPLLFMFSVPLFGLSLCQIGDMQFRYVGISKEQAALKDLEAGSLNEVAAGASIARRRVAPGGRGAPGLRPAVGGTAPPAN